MTENNLCTCGHEKAYHYFNDGICFYVEDDYGYCKKKCGKFKPKGKKKSLNNV